MCQEDWRDANIVIDYLPFGESGLRIKHFVEVRYLNLAISDAEFGFIRHVRKSFLDFARNDKHSGKEPLRISISTRKKQIGTLISVSGKRGMRTASFSVVTIIARSRRMQRLMNVVSSASV